MRHKTLVETNSDLQNMVRKIQDQTDAQQRAFQELMKVKKISCFLVLTFLLGKK